MNSYSTGDVSKSDEYNLVSGCISTYFEGSDEIGRVFLPKCETLESRVGVLLCSQRLFTPPCPPPVSKSAVLGNSALKTTGFLGAERFYVAIPKSRGFTTPKCQNRPSLPGISRGSGAQRPGDRPTRVLYATYTRRFRRSKQLGSGMQAHGQCKLEPAAWSWAQMTSGFGPWSLRGGQWASPPPE
jgi:hypothetical protein